MLGLIIISLTLQVSTIVYIIIHLHGTTGWTIKQEL